MRVRDIMTTAVITVGPEAPFHELVALMLDKGISGIPVVDEERRPIGIVTEADLVSKEAYGSRRRLLDVAAAAAFRAENTWAVKARAMKAHDLMSAPVRTVRLDDLVQLAAARMVTTGVKRFPVVDDDRQIVGIVSRSDVLQLFHRPDRMVTIDVDRVLRDPLLVPDDHDVSATVQDGTVTLAGRVSVPSHRRLIEAMVREVPGVIEIDSEGVTVTPGSAPAGG
jgi:CBS-domain-containing membrane protein